MLSKSKLINENYAAKIARVDAIEPIPEANSIVRAVLGENKVVVSKDTKVGDIVVFFPVGTIINGKYLRINNLYQDPDLNSSSKLYNYLLRLQKKIQEDPDYPNREQELQIVSQKLRSLRGMFNPNGRVRLIKLRGVYSEGFVAPVETLEKTWPALERIIWSKYLGELFDEVCGEEMCHKWIPPMHKTSESKGVPYEHRWWKLKQKKLKKFDRIIPNTFAFHYDTGMLANHIHHINPSDEITVTVKVHGTSAILANIPVRRKMSTWEKIKQFFGVNVPLFEYDHIYSSRRVIQNQYINPHNQEQSFYGGGDYDALQRDLSKFVAEDAIVYGELVGYKEGTDICYQRPCGIDHDYGCRPGEWAFMPYRITTNNNEWEVEEVKRWTESVIKFLPPEDQHKLLPINILYKGRAGDMYGLWNKITNQVTTEDYNRAVSEYKASANFAGYLPPELESLSNYTKHLWRIQWLETMKNDKDFLGMEMSEPMCNNKKVPREGIVIRIVGDPIKEAFKLKTVAHYSLSEKSADRGEADPEDLA